MAQALPRSRVTKILDGLSRERQAEKFRTSLTKKQTPSEKKFKAILKSLKVDYEFQKIIMLAKNFRIVDFYIPSKKIVIEVDGDYHQTYEQKQLDRKRSAQLIGKGVGKIYRFTNSEVDNTNDCIKRLKEIIK